MNPYVFIVGCPRSGTTLLRHILMAHPQITITPESHWIPVWFEERKGLTPDGMVTSQLIGLLLEHPRFARLRIGREELAGLMADGHPLSYSAFVTGILDLYGKRKHKLLVGTKTPQYVRRMPTLHSLWPRARFVHLIRDGRDVWLSLASWSKTPQTRLALLPTWKDDPVSTGALWWESNVRLGRESGKSLGPGLYYEVRYESLVAHPREECEALNAFLGLPYDDAMLRFDETQTKRKERRPITPGLRDWRTQMSGDDVERFEAMAGDLLDELGCPRAFPRLRPGRLEDASRIRARVEGGVEPEGSQ